MSGKKRNKTFHAPAVELVTEATTEALPPLFSVYLLNDDYTPTAFIVEVLERYFSMNRVLAEEVLSEVQDKGRGICGRYPRDVAETKVALVNEYSKRHEHPLCLHMQAS